MEIKTSKGTFIVVPSERGIKDYRVHGHGRNNNLLYYESDGYAVNEWFDHEIVIIGLVSEILKDEELSKKVVEQIGTWYAGYMLENSGYVFARLSFQSLCKKYELKESDLLIRKL